MNKVIDTMVSLNKQSRFRRLLAKTKNEAALSEHRQRLTDALTIFQVRISSMLSEDVSNCYTYRNYVYRSNRSSQLALAWQ